MVDSRPDGAMEPANGCVASGKRCFSLLCWFVCTSFKEVGGPFVRFGSLAVWVFSTVKNAGFVQSVVGSYERVGEKWLICLLFIFY